MAEDALGRPERRIQFFLEGWKKQPVLGREGVDRFWWRTAAGGSKSKSYRRATTLLALLRGVRGASRGSGGALWVGIWKLLSWLWAGGRSRGPQ